MGNIFCYMYIFWCITDQLLSEISVICQHAHLPSAEGFLPPKIVGTFYMQGYKVKEKTAIAPPVSKLSGHPDLLQCSS